MNWFNKRSGVENEGMGCGWGLVHIIKHHHWPHFFKRLTHHHKSKRILGSRTSATRTTNDIQEEHNKLINIVEETTDLAPPRKNSSIKARMRSLLAEEMLKLKTTRLSSHHDRSDGLNSIQSDLEPNHNKKNHETQKPKEYLDALGIISANEDFLVKVLQDPGSPLAHHFRNQQALSAKRALVKSETFPLPSSHNNKPTRLKPNNDQTKEEDRDNHRETRIVIKRLKDFKQKIIKHAIGERRKEMPKVVALDAIIHKIPIDNNTPNSIIGKNNKPKKPRQMRRASSLNDASGDRYSQIYENSLDREAKTRTVSEGARRTRVAPKHLARIYSLPDMKWYNNIDQSEELFDTFGSGPRKSFEEQTVLETPIIEKEEEDPVEIIPDEYEGVVIGQHEPESEIIVNEQEEEEEEEEEELSYVKAEFSYVKEILESSGLTLSDQTLMAYEEAKGCLVFDPDCCGNDKSGGKCDHPLLFDLINEVLMEIYANSYTYCPFPLSYLSHTCPMPVGQHVLKHVWGLISSYLSLSVDRSLDFVVGSDLAKSGWWMNLQFDCECVALELEDFIFHDLVDEILSDVRP